MSVYKDQNKGTWYVSFRYVDWTGEKRQKMKRGFRTKKKHRIMKQNLKDKHLRIWICCLKVLWIFILEIRRMS